jgi:hypothetical protein
VSRALAGSPVSPVPGAESVGGSRAFRVSCRRTTEGWPVLANACFAKIDHPLRRLSKVLQETLASRPKTHATEDDYGGPHHRPPSFPLADAVSAAQRRMPSGRRAA